MDMTRQWLGGTLVGLVLAGTALLWYSSAFAGDSSDKKVKANAVATKVGADGKQTVTVTLDIEKGWHIYANPVNLKGQEDNRTNITVKGSAKVSVSVKYPVGKVHVDGKDSFNIYEEKIVIPVEVVRTPGDAGPLRLSIEVNACKDRACLPPGTIELTVP
jgi:DsbC/DsbD-like thiol-disulfide interchange protein